MKVLVAEDQADLSRLLKIAIEHEGFTVDIANNGQEAVDLAAQNAYDVMILDIMMPVKDGITALKEIRQAGDDTYIIMLTAMTEIDDRVNGLDAGADDYMTKPYSIKELMARLRTLDRREKQYEQPLLQFGDLTLDPDEQRIESHNSISLSGKETKLLSIFMSNPNKEIPSQQLLNTVWDDDDQAEPADLWIYISYLRQKLQSINAHVQLVGNQDGPFALTTLE
ncbi:response regulator [Limosilactobacillus gastricus]|uniref:Two component response regulator n=1 Tax=Limosilactobacillus gastricus DSM 16045 TaxID=1423749 RepID=A0A0R1VCP2_9LACO|nr:response regulator transcription factor [Limosilactobacillus gastricus]KRM03296.1 Two component response regulator [Limosilactobacillus gastricus DSM 16045]QGF41085.1 response regulator [Limosilactobacillus gastricus]